MYTTKDVAGFIFMVARPPPKVNFMAEDGFSVQ
jgi:hypothetical protein